MVHRTGTVRRSGTRLVLVTTSRIYLVRHGRAAGGWDDDPDPGLDDIGRLQAEDTASVLAGLGPMPMVTSPLRRCRETAAFLQATWSTMDLRVEPRVREIPSPPAIPMGERVPWLRSAMGGTWSDLGSAYTQFRDDIVTFVASMTVDTVVFSHFIAINAAIGACLEDDRVVIASVDNASVTTIDVHESGTLTLVERGRQADTLIR